MKLISDGVLEAEAVSKKANEETSLMSIQVKAALLRECKRLLDEGVEQSDIDKMLPMN